MAAGATTKLISCLTLVVSVRSGLGFSFAARISALGTRPVSPDYLDKHQPRGVCLEHIRRDRILHEALATGADPLHLALVFNIDHTNAMAYANAARNLLSSPAEQALSRRPE
jgi:hypothetical protein